MGGCFYQRPQCLPGDIVPVRSRAWTLGMVWYGMYGRCLWRIAGGRNASAASHPPQTSTTPYTPYCTAAWICLYRIQKFAWQPVCSPQHWPVALVPPEEAEWKYQLRPEPIGTKASTVEARRKLQLVFRSLALTSFTSPQREVHFVKTKNKNSVSF